MENDIVKRLRGLAAMGSDVHYADWRAICGNMGVAANNIEQLREENARLLRLIKGVSDRIGECIENVSALTVSDLPRQDP